MAPVVNRVTIALAKVIDKSYALGLLRRIRQERNENVQIYAEQLLKPAEYMLQGEFQIPTTLVPIEQQLDGFFTLGLSQNQGHERKSREA